MAYKVAMSGAAEAEADEAYEWIAKGSPAAAARWYSGLLESIRSLADHPQRCPLALEDEFFSEEIRNLLYGKRKNVYRVLFTLRGDTVFVLHIRHAARAILKPKPGPENLEADH